MDGVWQWLLAQNGCQNNGRFWWLSANKGLSEQLNRRSNGVLGRTGWKFPLWTPRVPSSDDVSNGVPAGMISGSGNWGFSRLFLRTIASTFVTNSGRFVSWKKCPGFAQRTEKGLARPVQTGISHSPRETSRFDPKFYEILPFSDVWTCKAPLMEKCYVRFLSHTILSRVTLTIRLSFTNKY